MFVDSRLEISVTLKLVWFTLFCRMGTAVLFKNPTVPAMAITLFVVVFRRLLIWLTLVFRTATLCTVDVIVFHKLCTLADSAPPALNARFCT